MRGGWRPFVNTGCRMGEHAQQGRAECRRTGGHRGSGPGGDEEGAPLHRERRLWGVGGLTVIQSSHYFGWLDQGFSLYSSLRICLSSRPPPPPPTPCCSVAEDAEAMLDCTLLTPQPVAMLISSHVFVLSPCSPPPSNKTCSVAEDAEAMLDCYCRVDPDVDTETPLGLLADKFTP